MRDASAKCQHSDEVKPDDHEAYNNSGLALVVLARRQSGPEAIATFRDACTKFQRAVEIKPDFMEAFGNWGNALDGIARGQSGPEAIATFRDACAKYQRAVEVKRDNHPAFYNWGNALDGLARVLTGPDAIAAFKEACAKYQRAVEIKPDDHEAYHNWGIALAGLARTLTRPGAIAAFRDACTKFQRAAEIQPDFMEAYGNWGNALTKLANFVTGAEAIAFYDDACAKYQRAVEIQPDCMEAFINWGNALARLAGFRMGAEAIAVYRDACAKYQRAVEAKRDEHKALNNWGRALMSLGRIETEAARPSLSAEARRVLTEADRIKPGSADYNLARLEALEDHLDAAFLRLENALVATPGKWLSACAERDLKSLRSDPRWEVLKKKYSRTAIEDVSVLHARQDDNLAPPPAQGGEERERADGPTSPSPLRLPASPESEVHEEVRCPDSQNSTPSWLALVRADRAWKQGGLHLMDDHPAVVDDLEACRRRHGATDLWFAHYVVMSAWVFRYLFRRQYQRLRAADSESPDCAVFEHMVGQALLQAWTSAPGTYSSPPLDWDRIRREVSILGDVDAVFDYEQRQEHLLWCLGCQLPDPMGNRMSTTLDIDNILERHFGHQ